VLMAGAEADIRFLDWIGLEAPRKIRVQLMQDWCIRIILFQLIGSPRVEREWNKLQLVMAEFSFRLLLQMTFTICPDHDAEKQST